MDYLAEQLGMKDPSCVKQYTERRETRRWMAGHGWHDQPGFGLVCAEHRRQP